MHWVVTLIICLHKASMLDYYAFSVHTVHLTYHAGNNCVVFWLIFKLQN